MTCWQTAKRTILVILTFLVLLLSSTPLFAKQILVISDSWSKGVALGLRVVLKENGYTDISVDGRQNKGSAEGLSSPSGLNYIYSLIGPDTIIVHLQTGGNDWLASGWTSDWSSQAGDDLIQSIIADVETVVDYIRWLRPDIQVLWSSYDYLRPVNTYTYRGTPTEVNGFWRKWAEKAAQFASSKPGLSFVDVNGTLQVAYGFDGIQHTEYDPGYVIPPGDPSLPDPKLPSPFKPFLPNDFVELNPGGYEAVTRAQYDGYYASQLLDLYFQINPGLNDVWYEPATDGQGFFITVFPDLGSVSIAWFTYDTELPPDDATANLGDPGHRWITATGPYVNNQAVMNVVLTSGGIFDTASEIQRTDPPGSDGTLTLTFESCSSATVEYDLPSINRQGTIPIQRVADDNIAICEAFSAD